MQAQSLRQQTAITTQQSLGVIKTLLTASFGCIAYLRNLLPDENFGEGRLTSGERGSISTSPSSQLSIIGNNQQHISGVTVKTVTRGFSTEADKLLNYLEHGIFDAIERQYLKSFIFAIYLDNDDPNNIVESYTYNLTYYTVPGTTTTVPIISLDDQLDKLCLDGQSNAKNTDAVAQAALKGKSPTLGDVKQSIKALVKNLILATQTLEPLPKRRYATFKLFYRDNTPPDYEPPYFRPGDPEKEKFVFTTHDKSETPEKFSVGSVITPHHGIDVQVQSVAKYLPNGDVDDSHFIGIESVSKNVSKAKNGSADVGARSRQLEAQKKDAEARIIAWNADDSCWTDADAEGEDDPDYVDDSGISFAGLLGIRKPDGNIVPIDQHGGDAMDTDEVDAQFFGRPDIEPSQVGQLKKPTRRDIRDSVEATQQTYFPPLNNQTVDSYSGGEINTQLLKSAFDQSAMEWSGHNELLEMETQPANIPYQDSIQSSTQSTTRKCASKKPSSRVSDSKSIPDDVSCACEHTDETDVVYCEDCEKWLHIWCMGYTSPDDPRLPETYVCIPCRLQRDASFDLIKDVYPDILAAFQDLALFRRAIKIAESYDPESLKVFRSLSKCSASLSEQLWKRLEREGFITLEVIETDKLGLMETRTRATRSTKKVQSAKRVQKYSFNLGSKKTALYRDYFSPDSEAEKNILGLGRKARARKTRTERKKGDTDDTQDAIPTQTDIRGLSEGDPVSLEERQETQLDMESQTQDDTQYHAIPAKTQDLKRRTMSSQETIKTSKKVKISVVEENVDIEE